MNTIIAGVRNLGRAVAYNALKRGDSVLLNSRSEESLKGMVSSLQSYGKISYLSADLSSRDSIEQLFTTCESRYGQVDNLVVTLGGFMADRLPELKNMDVMIDNHIKIPMQILESFAKHAHAGSTAVLVSSVQSVFTTSWGAFSYVVGKTGLNKIVEAAAANLLSKGIRVNGVAPSVIEESFEPGRDWRSSRKLGDLSTPPEDIAEVVDFLTSVKSEWIDGVVIPVDGGNRFKTHPSD